MNPIQLVFSAVNFDGIKADLTTVFMGLIVCLLILAAIRHVLQSLGIIAGGEEHCTENDLRDLYKRKQAAKGFERDLLSRKYKRAWAKTQFKSDCK